MDDKEKLGVYEKIIELCKAFSHSKPGKQASKQLLINLLIPLPDDHFSFLEWGKARMEQAIADTKRSEKVWNIF